MTTTLIFNTISFYTTHLTLPKGRERVSNELANDLLLPVQWLFGQTLVENNGGAYVNITPKVQGYYPWIERALKIAAFVLLCRYFTPALLFTTTLVLGTLARAYSLRSYPEVYQGICGKKFFPHELSVKKPPLPTLTPPINLKLQEEKKRADVTRGVAILTPFIKKIPLLGNLEDYTDQIQKIESFFTEFLAIPEPTEVKTPVTDEDLDAMLDLTFADVMGPGALVDAKQWLKQQSESKDYFYPFALMRQFLYTYNRKSLETLNSKVVGLNLLKLYRQVMEKLERLGIHFWVQEMHNETNLALQAECTTLSKFFKELQVKDEISSELLEENLLKSYWLMDSEQLDLGIFRNNNKDSFENLEKLCSTICGMKQISFPFLEEIEEAIVQVDKTWTEKSETDSMTFSEMVPAREEGYTLVSLETSSSNDSKAVSRNTAILTAFFQSIPAMGDLTPYEAQIQKLEPFLTEFLNTPQAEVAGWLTGKYEETPNFYPFALMRALTMQPDTEWKDLSKRSVARLERLNLKTYLDEIHPETLRMIQKELAEGIAFFTTLLTTPSQDTIELEKRYLKAKYLLESRHPLLSLIRGRLSTTSSSATLTTLKNLLVEVEDFPEFKHSNSWQPLLRALTKIEISTIPDVLEDPISQIPDILGLAEMAEMMMRMCHIPNIPSGGPPQNPSELINRALSLTIDFFVDFLSIFTTNSPPREVQKWLDEQSHLKNYCSPFAILSSALECKDLDPTNLALLKKLYNKISTLLNQLKLSDYLQEAEPKQVALISRKMHHDFNGLLAILAADDDELPQMLQARLDPISQQVDCLVGAALDLQLKDADPVLRLVFKKLDPAFVTEFFDAYQKSVNKLERLNLGRFLPNQQIINVIKLMVGLSQNPAASALGQAANFVGQGVSAAKNFFFPQSSKNSVTSLEQQFGTEALGEFKAVVEKNEKKLNQMNSYFTKFLEEPDDEAAKKFLNDSSQEPGYLYPFLESELTFAREMNPLFSEISSRPFMPSFMTELKKLHETFSKCESKLTRLGFSHYLGEFPSKTLETLIDKLKQQTRFFQQFIAVASNQDNTPAAIRQWITGRADAQGLTPFARAHVYFNDLLLKEEAQFCTEKLDSRDESREIFKTYKDAYTESRDLLSKLKIVETSLLDPVKYELYRQSFSNTHTLSDTINLF